MSLTDPAAPTVGTSGSPIEEADIAIAQQLGKYRYHPAVRALGALSEVADQAPSIVTCGAVITVGLISRKPRVAEAGARMLASVLVATALKSAVEGLVSRTRPHVLIEQGAYDFRPPGRDGHDLNSFPSGHTSDATAAASGFVRVFPGASGPAYVTAAVIAAVQIPRARHYPLDVAAGVLIGSVSEALVHRAAVFVRGRVRETWQPDPRRRAAPN